MQRQQQLHLDRGLQHCPSLAALRPVQTPRGCRAARSAPGRKLSAPAATAAAATDTAPGGAASSKRPRKYNTKKMQAEQEEPTQPQEPDLPVPLDYQQTLIKSFTLGGVGLHSGEYAWVRVRPAFAGEGRYFVRVPEGTNRELFKFEDENIMDKMTPEEALEAQEPEEDEDIEELKLDWFEVYLRAQEERGYEGSFDMFLRLQVDLEELADGTYRKIMGITADNMDGEEYPDMGPEPDLSAVIEEIQPLEKDDATVVMASISSVVDFELDLPYTQLGEGDNRVMGVELLLAALEACGVDNARIEVEGGHEIPVLDNSALGWCIEVQCAGMRPAPVRFEDEVPEGKLPIIRRDVIMPSKAIAVHDEEGWITFFPGPFANLTFGVDHSHVAPVIGSMWFTWRSEDHHFRYALAPARGYVESLHQLFAMRDAGFVKGGAENLLNIADGDKWWDEDMLRMVYDEPVRYRLAQLVGNLSLLNVAGCQGIPVGHVTAHNATPALQLAFVSAVLDSIERENVVSVNEVVELQDSWLEERYQGFERRTSMSQGPEPTMGDGTPASIEADVEVMGEDEEA